MKTNKTRSFKIQANIMGTGFYYVIYEKLWWGGWDSLGGCFKTQEEALEALGKVANTKYVTYNYIKEGGDGENGQKEKEERLLGQ